MHKGTKYTFRGKSFGTTFFPFRVNPFSETMRIELEVKKTSFLFKLHIHSVDFLPFFTMGTAFVTSCFFSLQTDSTLTGNNFLTFR